MPAIKAPLAVVLLCLLAACAPFAGHNASLGGATCGPFSPVDPNLHLAVAGPLVFAGGLSTTHAIVGDFAPGVPSKVGISPQHPLTRPLTLDGWDCTTGARLRFWYHSGSPFASVPVSQVELAGTGDLEAVLPPTTQDIYPGYMLFTHPGPWKVMVRQDDQVLGSVVFDVLAPHTAAPR